MADPAKTEFTRKARSHLKKDTRLSSCLKGNPPGRPRETYLQHLLQNVPHQPGIYKMKDAQGSVIYIGKAKDLKHRVSSYFQRTDEKEMRTQKMVEQIADIEYIEVGTELEALMLETNLIKELRPKYNILMKDDKNYVYIKITVQEEYPRVFLVRKVAKDKARYFGPKTSGHKVIKTLKVLKRVFPFRNCELAIDFTTHTDSRPEKPIPPHQLEYHQKHCIGPCMMSVKPQEYHQMIQQLIDFFEGKHEKVIARIKEDMMQAAAQKKFEIAGVIRDRLKAVEEMVETQRINDPTQKDLDIINYVVQDEKAYFNLFQLRGGKLIDQENFTLKVEQGNEAGNSNILTAFLEQYYEKATDIPKEVLIPHEIDDIKTIETWLSQMKNQQVSLLIPERGKKNQLLELSAMNAKSFARQSQVKWQGEAKPDRSRALEELQEILHLSKIPKRMECYDISHFSGTETVSSMVVFENGFPKKEDYRKFKLHQQTSGSPDDFASMEETLTRRLKHLKPALAKAEIKLRKPKKTELATIYKELKLPLPEKIKKQPKAQKSKQRTIELTSPITTKLTLTEPVFHFLMIENRTKIVGWVQIIFYPNGKTLLNTLVLTQEPDLQLLIKKILEKTKTKRLYYACPKADQSHFEAIGFQPLQKIPTEFDDINSAHDKTFLVFDRTKFSEDKSFKKLPDLIIIDGGKGQLSSAQKALHKYALQIPMISIAKKEEELFMPGNPQSIRLEDHNPILHMVQHIRNEAHRFAVSYHHALRLKATTASALDEIPGLGPKLRIKLLSHFGSLENIKNQPEEALIKVVGKKAAAIIKRSAHCI